MRLRRMRERKEVKMKETTAIASSAMKKLEISSSSPVFIMRFA